MSSYPGKRLCDIMDDGLDDLLSQAVDRCEKEVDLDCDGLDGILSQSLDIFEQKSLDDDAIDITDMFESGDPSLVMARRFRTAKGNPFETSCASVLYAVGSQQARNISKSPLNIFLYFVFKINFFNQLAINFHLWKLNNYVGELYKSILRK